MKREIPAGVERLGIALEPEADYERQPDGGGGCEDPRVTFVEPLQHYLMTYTAFSPVAPASPQQRRRTCFTGNGWGLSLLLRFRAWISATLTTRMPAHSPPPFRILPGNRSWPCFTGPYFPALLPRRTARHGPPSREDIDRESIWISYRPISLEAFNQVSDQFSHHRLAAPVSPWERLKIGCGTPPILTRHGWLIVYHGVSEIGQAQRIRCKVRIAFVTRPA
jgi:hypothetical protein